MSFAFYSRILMTIPPYLAFLVIGGIYIGKNSGKRPWRLSLYLISPLFISVSGYMCYALFMSKTHSFSALTHSLSISLEYALNEKAFTLLLAGLDDTARNISLMFGSFAAHLLVIAALILSVMKISSFSIREKRTYLSFLLAIVTVSIIFIGTQNHNVLFLQYSCLPLILIVGTAYSIKGLRSSDYKEPLALLTLFLISLSVIPRIFFRTIPYPYGFYLLPLSLICYYIFFFKLLRNFLQIYFDKYLKSYSLILGIFFISLIIPYVKKSSSMYAANNIKVETARGTLFFSQEHKASRVKGILKYLEENTRENDTLVVFPEGVALNYFSQRDNPLKLHIYTPPPVRMATEDRLISWLLQYNVDYIIIAQRETDEYGYPRFGIDYGTGISSWINDKCSVGGHVGPAPFTSDEFGAVILKNKKLL